MKFVTGYTYTDEQGDTLNFHVYEDEGVLNAAFDIHGHQDHSQEPLEGRLGGMSPVEMYHLAHVISSIPAPLPEDELSPLIDELLADFN